MNIPFASRAQSFRKWLRHYVTVKNTLGAELFLRPLPPRALLPRIALKFTIIFGLFLFVVLGADYIVFQQRRDHEMRDFQRQEAESIKAVQHHIIDRIATGMTDLLFLRELPEMEDYAASGDAKELRLLEKDLIGILRLRENYDKIRLIDPKGMEVMRVECAGGNPVPVPASQLQDKSGRYYFKIMEALKPGEVAVTPADYIEENGKIVHPLKATFRLMTGVFRSDGRRLGSLVINYDADKLFKEFDSMGVTQFQISVLDRKGHWMRRGGQEMEVDLSESGVLLSPFWPLLQYLGRSNKGAFSNHDGLYSYRTFDPIQETLDLHPAIAKRLRPAEIAKGEGCVILSHISTQQIASMRQFSLYVNVLVLIILLGPASIGTWFLAQSLVLKSEADKRTREAQATLLQITDSIPGAVFKLVLSRDGTGVFSFMSCGARDIFGMQRQSAPVRYEQIVSLILPSDKAEYEESVGEAFQIGGGWSCEFRIYDGNASLKWIRASATLSRIDSRRVQLCGIFTDVTSLKIAEMKRRASEERLDLALQAANDGLWDWNVAEGTTYFSPRWMQMLGYEPNELPHHFHTWKNLLHPDDLKPTMKVLANNIENRIDHYEVEYRMRTKNGGWKWLLSRGAVVQRDPLGRPERIVGTHTDISERKDLERSLKAAKDAAEHANKAKSSFLAIMSHELRTPMNSVCGFADSLKRTELNQQQMDYAQKIEKSASKLLFLINDILDYSKIEAGRLKLESIPFDFVHTVRESADLLLPQFEAKNLKFEFINEGPAQMPVRGDPTRVHQVLVNLLANAIKFTDQGSISVRIVSRPIDSRRCELEVSVRDSGIGMSVDQQAALFQPFSQLDSSTTRKYGGTGLGLAICKRLCEMMNGHIWVVSQPGQGSTFTFSLKMTQAELSPAAQTPDKSGKPESKPSADTNRSGSHIQKFGWKVLWADHDEVSRMVAAQLLSDINCEVVFIGSEGSSLSEAVVKECQAALFDEQMIQNGTYARVRELVAQQGGRPFYFMGLAENALDKHLPVEGIDIWVSTPVDIRGLSRAFAKAATSARLESSSLTS
jgi:PAS domain S-box-containing protein